MGYTRAIVLMFVHRCKFKGRVVVCGRASGILEWVDHAGTPRLESDNLTSKGMQTVLESRSRDICIVPAERVLGS